MLLSVAILIKPRAMSKEPETTLDDQIIPPPEIMPSWEAVPEVVKLGDPVLRRKADPVTRILTSDTQKLIEHMKVVMHKANGLGLAAPQVGVSKRVIIYEIDDELQVIVNPIISGGRGEQLEPIEGCLSIPNLHGVVKRFQELKVKGQDQRGRPISKKVTDLEARVIQHEVDHLDGILFIDRAERSSLVWAMPGRKGDEDEETDQPAFPD